LSGIRPGGASDDVYDPILWDGSLTPPTQNAVRDLIEDYIIPLISGEDPTSIVMNVFNEVSAVASGSETLVVSYTVPVGKQVILYFAEGTGNNIAKYQLYRDSDLERVNYSWWANGLNFHMSFSVGNNQGPVFDAGEQIRLTVLHDRPSSGVFSASLLFKEKDV
jgi:hypothetical protein